MFQDISGAGADRIPLTHLPRELRRAGGPEVSYRRLYSLCLDGRFPAERGSTGWTVARDDLPAVIAALGRKNSHRSASFKTEAA
jgi:hypothetical protein